MKLTKRLMWNTGNYYVSFTKYECRKYALNGGDKLILTVDGMELPPRTARAVSDTLIRVYLPRAFNGQFKKDKLCDVSVRKYV